LAWLLAACAPATAGDPIMASSGTSGMMAVTAENATSVRILYVRGGSIVLARMVFMPPGERVRSVQWSSDGRDAVIATSRGVLALDTRTWRLEPRARLAATSRDDAGIGWPR
jgi:hypothetical protein